VYPSRKYLDEFVREHPRMALLMLAWGVGLMVFTGWVVVSDWQAGR
jgi:hypothetical protein